jgi:hypothetical protein
MKAKSLYSRKQFQKLHLKKIDLLNEGKYECGGITVHAIKRCALYFVVRAS